MTKNEIAEYKQIKIQMAKLQERAKEINPYAELRSMSAKKFGEDWSENHVLEHASNLQKNHGAGHDMRGKHYDKIEVKSSRNTFEQEWTMNQVHPNQADAYLFVWYNCDEATDQMCFVPTEELLQHCSRSRQHGDGCFTVSSTFKNKQFLKKYMYSSWDALNEVV